MVSGYLSRLKNRRLSIRLAVSIIGCSIMIALLTGGIQLYFEYHQDIETIYENFDFFERSYLPAIATSSYLMDNEQLMIQLKGALQIQGIEYLQVTEQRSGEPFRLFIGQPEVPRNITKEYDLIYQKSDDEKITVGKVLLKASLAGIYLRLQQHAAVILLTTGAGLMLVALFIIAILEFTVARHLGKMTGYTDQLNIDKLDLELGLNRRAGKIFRPDELDNLVDTINDLRIRLKQDIAARKQAQEALRQSEVNYRSIFNSVNDAIAIQDMETGEFLDVNQKYCELFGYTRDEVCKRTVGDLSSGEPPYTQENGVALVRKAAEGKPQLFDWMAKDSRGKLFWIEVNLKRATIEGQNRLLAVVRDITERKRAEERLRKNEERYRIVAKFAYDWEYWLGSEGDIKYTAPSCERLTGYSADAFIKNPSLLTSIVHEDDRELVADHLNFENDPNRDDINSLEFKIVTLDGQVKWINHYCVPVYADDGTFMGRRASNRDITDRKFNEKRLMESELRFRELFDNMLSSIAIYDSPDNGQSFIFKDINKIGLKYAHNNKKDIVGRDVREVFPGVEAFGLLDIFKRVWKSGKPEYHPSSWYKDDQLEFWVQYHVCKLPSGELFAIYEDTTAQRKAEEGKNQLEKQFLQAQKMEAVGTLAGGIAHDFNNILAAIVGYTELALSKSAEGASHYDDLQEVFHAGLRARDLIKQILTFSRQAEQKIQPVRVNLIVNEALKFLRSSLPASIEIRRNITSNAQVLADPTQVHQVLMNLCTNAKHAMERTGGVLKISLAEVQVDADFAATHPEAVAGPHLKLAVADSGQGMSAEMLEKIFDPFFTTKGKEEGTGLGLAVVHGIVKSCGGFITVSSEPGQGTTFNVFWPVIEAQDQPQDEFKGPLPTGTERVLFVDDEKLLADVGKQMLERHGYQVTLRTSSVEALELFKAKPDHFDLVITDMTMPNMSGLELTSEIIGLRPKMRIILCTGFSEKITAAGAEAAGFKAFMLKPVSLDDLIHTVRKVLDASH